MMEEFEAKYQFLMALKDVSGYTRLEGSGHYSFIQDITNEKWEEIGRDIYNSYYLKEIELSHGTLDDEKMSYLFRGLTGSSLIAILSLERNEISAAGVRSMLPFLQHATKLQKLDLHGNNIQSEGFNILCRALCDSPIEHLYCRECGIESIEIGTEHFPRYLTDLDLTENNINADGCRELAKLLQRGDSALKILSLCNCGIEDEGVAVLVESLRNNTSLEGLLLWRNDGITEGGLVTLLKLLDSISSVKATLQSNHTLRYIHLDGFEEVKSQQLMQHIDTATKINEEFGDNPEAASKEKVIQTQLHSTNRAELAELQGVSQSVYSEINPLHLPEILSLVGRRHGQGELYVALKSSIAEVISTVNRKKQITKQLVCCKERSKALNAELVEIKRKLAYYETMSKELNSELAEMEAAEGVEVEDESCEAPRSKRRCY